MVITRLGTGRRRDRAGSTRMPSSGRSTVLREYRAVMDEHGVERTRIAATSAARDASNAEDFFGAGRARWSAPGPSCSAATRRAR